ARRHANTVGSGDGPARPLSRPERSATGSAAELRLTLPETIRLVAGRSVSIPVEGTRGGFTGPLTGHFEGLPPGVALPDLTIPAGQVRAEGHAVARPDAAVATVPLRMVARAGSRQAEAALRLQVSAQAPQALESRGFALLACGRAAEAVAALTAALESGASDSRLYHNRGVGYAFLNQLDRA